MEEVMTHPDAYVAALEGQRNRLWHAIEMALYELAAVPSDKARDAPEVATAISILEQSLKAKCAACVNDDHEHCANFRGLAVAKHGTPEYKLMVAVFGTEKIMGCCCEHE